MTKFKVRIEQMVPEVAFQIVEAETAEDAMDKALADDGGPYRTGNDFEYDCRAGITERDVVSATPVEDTGS